MGRVSGKVALVTGAGGGIGRGCAIELAKEGAAVAVADIDDQGVKETVAMITANGGKAKGYHLDVSNEAEWKKTVDVIKADFGGLNVLVNNAGICISTPLLEMSTESYRRQNSVNMDGVFFGMRESVPLIAASGGGSIINISSAAGLVGLPGMVGYCGTKGAVRLMSKAAALEFGSKKIRVNSLHPGAVETPIWLKLSNDGKMPDLDPSNNDPYAENRKAGEESTVLGYAGVPVDIAAGVLFLASDESRFMTGSELVIDGGATAV